MAKKKRRSKKRTKGGASKVGGARSPAPSRLAKLPPPEASERPPAASAREPSDPRGLVLVVDTNKANRSRTKKAIEESGLALAYADNARAARAQLSAPSLELVIANFNEATAPEALSYAIAALPPPVPALLVLFPSGTDRIEAQAETDRLSAQAGLVRPLPSATLGVIACALARGVRLERALAGAQSSFKAARIAATPVDPGTGLYRFEHFKPLLTQEIKRSARYGLPFALLLIAFDGIDAVQVAQGEELAETLEGGLRLSVAKALRDQDLAVDLGPGQLLCVLPHTARTGARVVADRMRRRILKTRLALIEGSAGTTASLGIAAYQGRGPVSFASLMREARQALLIAQKAGGNRAAELPRPRRRR